ncbi:nucleoside hydrolase [Leptolyngbya sp. 15MV]|nr:nucleoside hydrolase [Leptolyngbya sp. 15MV]
MVVAIDCDPGHDDVGAILYAARHLDLRAVTVVAGNAPLAECVKNALAMTEAAGIDVPVHVGATDPIVGKATHAPQGHGKSGLDGADRPAYTKQPTPGRAVDALLKLADQHAGRLRIAAVGPLTNIALCLLLEPGFADAVAEVSIMGGAVGTGGTTPAAEFNFFADPVAARIVLESRLKLRVVGYDITKDVGLRAEDIARLTGSGKRIPALLGHLQDFYRGRHHAMFGRMHAPQHDVLAVIPWVEEGALTYQQCSGTVCTESGPMWGMSVFDIRGRLDSPAPANIALARHADRDRIIGAVMDTLLTYH